METLEIIIGMVFIYLLLSLLATILQEFWAGITSLRGKVLLKAVAKLLEVENQSVVTGISKDRLLRNFKRQIKESKVYQKYCDRFIGIKQLPSYLSAEQVTNIIKELLEKNAAAETSTLPEKSTSADRGLTFQTQDLPRAAMPEPTLLASMEQQDLKSQLNILLQPSAASYLPGTRSITDSGEAPIPTDDSMVTKAKAAFKKQYDEIMDRATGWYKLGIQSNLIVIGLLIGFAFDADTFKIYNNLTSNPEARAQLLQLAENFEESNKIAVYSNSLDSIKVLQDTVRAAQLRGLIDTFVINEIRTVPSPIGLGWDEKSYNSVFKNPIMLHRTWGDWIRNFIVKLGGWLVTALAVSLGAPFWFDLLQKLIHIRNAGNRPQDEEKKRVTATVTTQEE